MQNPFTKQHFRLKQNNLKSLNMSEPGNNQLDFCVASHFIDPHSMQPSDSLITSATYLPDNAQLCLTKCGFHLIKGSVGCGVSPVWGMGVRKQQTMARVSKTVCLCLGAEADLKSFKLLLNVSMKTGTAKTKRTSVHYRLKTYLM